MKITCVAVAGIFAGELFVFPAQTCDDERGMAQDYLPLAIINGQKIFLSKSAAKELSDVLLGFADG